jgi:hypothetical protein
MSKNGEGKPRHDLTALKKIHYDCEPKMAQKILSCQ